MGQTAGEIRRDIEKTREHTAETLDAIAYRVDIPARVRHRASTISRSIRDALFGVKKEGEEMARGVLSDAGEVVDLAERRLGNVAADVQGGLSEMKEKVVDTFKTEEPRRVETGYSSMRYPTETAGYEKTGDETAKRRARQVGSWAKDNALVIGVGAFAAALAAGMLIPRTRVETEKIAPLATELKDKAVESGERAVGKAMAGGEKMIGAKLNRSKESEKDQPRRRDAAIS